MRQMLGLEVVEVEASEGATQPRTMKMKMTLRRQREAQQRARILLTRYKAPSGRLRIPMRALYPVVRL
jgi:hypothetical protein